MWAMAEKMINRENGSAWLLQILVGVAIILAGGALGFLFAHTQEPSHGPMEIRVNYIERGIERMEEARREADERLLEEIREVKSIVEELRD